MNFDCVPSSTDVSWCSTNVGAELFG